MGIKERRHREKQITREAILSASRQIARTQGWTALTIRKVAEQIEYSPSMVYEYFASKEEILLTLLQEGSQQLARAMQEARATCADPEAQLYKIGEAFWQFARTSPDLYQVMHGQGGIPLDAEAVANAVEAVTSTTLETLLEWGKANGVKFEDAWGSIEVLWSVLHGLVSLSVVGRLDEDRALHLMKQTVADLLLAWTARGRGD
ncbi:MAG: TetR/AcrR family transcriptional regulator [Chloroflexi bacterium]|nr:TetR/AcrR family transcriptional regulator [Chloroflexota bacterium]OJV88458.1 MAG: hypothetical protein BGO39_17590 [Chloroflexi bacterium 54-19]